MQQLLEFLEPRGTSILHKLQKVPKCGVFDKNMTFLDKKSGTGLFLGVILAFSGPDFEPRTPGNPEARAKSPEWGPGLWDSGSLDFFRT